MSTQSWNLIESDPGIFSQMISELGVKDVEVDELYSLEPHIAEQYKPIYGFIFLFKITHTPDTRTVLTSWDKSKLVFAKQQISNACATQAILNLLLNVPDIEIGEILQNIKEFAQFLSPTDLGDTLGDHGLLRQIHNSFSTTEMFDLKRPATKDDDLYHFIAYVPVDGKLYELDGLKSGPILLEEKLASDWVPQCLSHIQKRCASYKPGETDFTLLTVGKDRVKVLNAELEQTQATLQKLLKAKQQHAGGDIDPELQDVTVDAAMLAMSDAHLEEQLSLFSDNMKQIMSSLVHHKRRQQRNKDYVITKRHNYIPFVVELLKCVGSSGKLPQLVEKAQEKIDTEWNKKQQETLPKSSTTTAK